MKYYGLTFACLIFAGCSTPDPAIKNQLGTVAASCILKFATTLDDGISPADTVAIGVMSRCQTEINAYDEARLPQRDTAYGSGAWAGRNIGWIKQITSMVLEARAKRR
jgi:hypothetical protein